MAINLNEVFTLGAHVEVDGDHLESKFKEAWVIGSIEAKANFNRGPQTFKIRIPNEKNRATVSINAIRPIQPPEPFPVPKFQQGEVVEYLKNNIWSKVTILRAVHAGNEYEVRATSSQKVETESRDNLRPKKEWKPRDGGLWEQY